MAKKPARREQIASKRPRLARVKGMSLKTRQRLLDTLIDSALDGLSGADAINEISAQLVRRGTCLVAEHFEFDPATAILLHPAHPVTKILNAINEHMEATNEDGDALAARLINCLGSQAAAGTQPN